MRIRVPMFAALVLIATTASAHASEVQAGQASSCQFVLGFQTLADMLSTPLVGACEENEHHNPVNGDGLQQTAGGLLVWRKADNWTAFTNGTDTWINGPFGLAYRANDQRFSWEADASGFSAPPTSGPRCGTERWPVKTLSDAGASSVDLTPHPIGVDALRTQPKPSVGMNTPRMKGVEMTTFTVQATLLRMSLEDDEDIHLVIADPSDASHTMIVEFPNPPCDGVVESTVHAQIAAARIGFMDVCGMPVHGRFTNLTGSATLTGVGFFDVIHGQSGVAPNGIELHPVIRADSVRC